MSQPRFCEKCNKIVPDSEVKELKFKENSSFFHAYNVVENAYKNQRPGVIGYCPVNRHVLCAKLREPTDQEYFIYHTCK